MPEFVRTMAFTTVPDDNTGSRLDHYLNQLPLQHDFEPFETEDRDLDNDEFLALPSTRKGLGFSETLQEPLFGNQPQTYSLNEDTLTLCECEQCENGILCPTCMQSLLDSFHDCPDLTNDSSAVTSASNSAAISRTSSGSNLASSNSAGTPGVISTTIIRRSKRIEGGYPCPQPFCEKTFDRQSDLNHHARRHQKTAERAHGCNNCEQRFHFPKDLRRHRQRVHAELPKPPARRPQNPSRARSPLSSSANHPEPSKRKRPTTTSPPPIEPEPLHTPFSLPIPHNPLPLPDVGRPLGPLTKQTALCWLGAIRNLLSYDPQQALAAETERALDLIGGQLEVLRLGDRGV